MSKFDRIILKISVIILLLGIGLSVTLMVLQSQKASNIVKDIHKQIESIRDKQILIETLLERRHINHIVKTLQIPDERLDAVTLVYKYAKASNLDIELIMALVFTESSFRVDANNSGRDIGLFQINKYVHKKVDVYDLCSNIEYGISFLEDLAKKYNNCITSALKHYNGGYRAFNSTKAKTYANKVITTAQKLKLA